MQIRYFPYLYNQRSNIAKITYIASRCIRTAQSTSSGRTLLLVCRLWAKDTCIGQTKYCTPSVRPSVCPAPTIYSKSECHRNSIFLGHLMQDTSNCDSDRFVDEWLTIRCKLGKNLQWLTEYKHKCGMALFVRAACRSGHLAVHLLVRLTSRNNVLETEFTSDRVWRKKRGRQGVGRQVGVWETGRHSTICRWMTLTRGLKETRVAPVCIVSTAHVGKYAVNRSGAPSDMKSNSARTYRRESIDSWRLTLTTTAVMKSAQ